MVRSTGQLGVNFGDVISVDFGIPIGSEAGFQRPAILVTADGFLRYRPTSVYVVPLTTTRRTFPSHVPVSPDSSNGLTQQSWALVEQLRAVAVERCGPPVGNVGPMVAVQLVDVIALIVGLQ